MRYVFHIIGVFAYRKYGPLDYALNMRWCLCLLIMVPLWGCNHEITPPLNDDRDRDGAVDLAWLEGPPQQVWREGGAAFDLGFPASCTTTTPTDPGSGDCSKLANWRCIDRCGDFDRLACFAGGAVARELRCNSLGQCQCKIAGQAPFVCLGILDSGRTGCVHAEEVFNQGCCGS